MITPTIQVMQDEHGCSRQFGFVAYEHVDDARQALQAMNGKSINGRPILVAMCVLPPLSVSYLPPLLSSFPGFRTMPKLQRREELARQIAQNRFQTQSMQPLYSRGPVMQQQKMVGFPQMRTQLPFYAAQPSFRGPFPAPYPPSANPQFVQRAMMYPQQNVPVSYGGGRCRFGGEGRLVLHE
jgi:RNA recognition motif-containing protein